MQLFGGATGVTMFEDFFVKDDSVTQGDSVTLPKAGDLPPLNLDNQYDSFKQAVGAEAARVAQCLPEQLKRFSVADGFVMAAVAGGQEDAAFKSPMKLPKELEGMKPDSSSKVGDITTTKWSNGYEHKKYENGSEVLTNKQGQVVSQLDASDLTKIANGWSQEQATFEYDSKGNITKMTLSDPSDAKARTSVVEVGKRQNRAEWPNGQISEIIAIAGDNPGYKMVDKQGAEATVYLKGAGTSIDKPGDFSMTHEYEYLREKQKSPDGLTDLPAGTKLAKIGLKSQPNLLFFEAQIGDPADNRETCYYSNKSGKMTLESEHYKEPINYDTKVGGMPHTEKGVIGWDKTGDGIILLRLNPKEESLIERSVLLRQDAQGNITAVEEPDLEDIPDPGDGAYENGGGGGSSR